MPDTQPKTAVDPKIRLAVAEARLADALAEYVNATEDATPGKMGAFDVGSLVALITQLVSAAPAVIAMIQQIIAIFKRPTPTPTPAPGPVPQP